MSFDPLSITWVIVLAVTLSPVRGDKVTFKDDPAEEHPAYDGKYIKRL